MKKKTKKQSSRLARTFALVGLGVVALALSMSPLMWSSTLVASAHEHTQNTHNQHDNHDNGDQGDGHDGQNNQDNNDQSLQQLCTNGIDDDHDGLTDLQDPDCVQFIPVCTETQYVNDQFQCVDEPVCTETQHLDNHICVDNPPVDPICSETQHLDNHVCVENTPVDPVCTETQHLDNHICVENPPVDPVCSETQHLDNHVCVENTPADTTSSDTSTSGGGGGGGGIVSGPFSFGFVHGSTSNDGGQVLGASTDLPSGCSATLTTFLRKGDNKPEQIKKLQAFLNKYLGINLPVNGIFGAKTEQAVKDFQLKHWEEVLKPWTAHGLSSDHAATGYVYKTTQRMINILECSSLNLPIPMLP